ncbi:MAG: hypothetical protein QNJ55_30310 [Xenococcus sp. MO_188.B8]|nr:hypothetical protein [Xenococcus sp. MO_188.B8]
MNFNSRGFSKVTAGLLMLLLSLAFAALGAGWIISVVLGILIGIAFLILTTSIGNRIQNFSNVIAYILIAIATLTLIIFGIPKIQESLKAPDLVYGYVGGERYDLLVRNNKVQKLLSDADLQVTDASTTKKGSVSQLQVFNQATSQSLDSLDYVWTGDSAIAEAGKEIIEANGKKVLENEATLLDPLVLVVNRKAANKMSKSGFFSALSDNSFKSSGFSYELDTVKFADLLEGDSTWNEIGITRYASPPGIIMADARKSNGGVMAETLIGTIWYNMALQGIADTPSLETSKQINQFRPLPTNIPQELSQKMQELRLRSGFAESTSSKLKVQLEEGGSPWALTYYSLGRNITKTNPEFTLVALSHTMVSSNQLLSFSEKGTRLLRVIESGEFQKIAQEYGYDAPQGSWIVLSDPTFEAVRSLTNLPL